MYNTVITSWVNQAHQPAGKLRRFTAVLHFFLLLFYSNFVCAGSRLKLKFVRVEKDHVSNGQKSRDLFNRPQLAVSEEVFFE